VRFLSVFVLLFVFPYSLRYRERKKRSVRNTRALAYSFGQPTARLMSGLSLDSTVSRTSRHSIDQSRVSILTGGNKHMSLCACDIVVTALQDDPAVTLSLSLLLVTMIRSLTFIKRFRLASLCVFKESFSKCQPRRMSFVSFTLLFNLERDNEWLIVH